MRVLVDSTVWIDFFRARQNSQTRQLKALLAAGEDACICGHILSEVLRGTRHDDQYTKVERYFRALQFLSMDKETFMVAADIYRHLRRSGITLKNTMDTYIAATALQHSAYLIHNDSDFNLIANHTSLKILPVS